MNRETRRAETRARLLDAAAEVFARLGFHAATLDDVAAAAGYTKGAVYSNFAGKDALFLALLDRHLDSQSQQIERLFDAGATGGLLGGVEHESTRALESGAAFGMLTMEFWLYAMRHPEARTALATRYGRMRDRLAEAITERHQARGSVPPRSSADVATLVLAVDAGLFIQHLADPRSVPAQLRAEAIVDLIDAGGR